MTRPFLAALLCLYRWLAPLVRSGPGQRLFEFIYLAYKTHLEAGPIDALHAYVRPGTDVIDVGANIGFFTCRFAHWITPGAQVHAFEPESRNFRSLSRRVERLGLSDVVAVVEAAVTDEDGSAALALNPVHPGDHRLAAHGLPVRAVTLDTFLRTRGSPEVSLIKIDVQGAEAKVIAGARETLSRCAPAVYMELDRGALQAQGSNPEALVETLAKLGYRPYRLQRAGEPTAIAPGDFQQLERARGYLDVLFLRGAAPASTP